MPIGVNNDDSLFVVAALCRMGIEMRPRAEKSYTPKRKTPADGEGLSFGRTRRITQNKLERVLSLRASRLWRSVPNASAVAFDRTADLYHVKADWPHQDTHGHRETRLEITGGQAGRLALT